MLRDVELPIDVEALRRVLRRHGVRYAYVFGSHAEGSATSRSDVDVAVAGEVDDWALRGALPDVVDLTLLETAPRLLAGRIASRGRVLLDDDPPARVRWEAQMRKLHADEHHRRRQYRRDFAAGARAATRG